jgi:hypothetical protein
MKSSDNFKELQHLWQRRGAAATDSPVDAASLFAGRLKSFEKKQLRINLVKTAALVLILVPFFSYLLLYKSASAAVMAGAGWILISTAAFMVLYWKKQFRYTSLDLNLPGSEFINSVLDKLNYHKKLFRIHFPLFGFSLLLGINIIYLGVFGQYDLSARLIYHFAGSFFVLAAVPLGIKIRKIKFNREYQPLIEELEAVKEDMKG